MPKSCLWIAVGVIVRLLMLAAGLNGYTPNTATFFLILLPWIVLNAGYFLPFWSLLDKISIVAMFAAFTIWNTLFVGLTLWCFGRMRAIAQLTPVHMLVFASSLAAVDPFAVRAVFEDVPANELLYVVHAEPLLNNGMALVSLLTVLLLYSTGIVLYYRLLECETL